MAAVHADDRRTADVLVIGAGAAGVSAATEAAVRGLRVTVVDAAPAVGGTAQHAGGGICFAGTPLQAALAIDDDPDLALEDWVRWGGGTADVVWAARYLEGAVGDVHDHLCSLGVRWDRVLLEEGNRVPRWHGAAGGGAAIMRALERRARAERGIRWELGTRVHGLSTQGGAVVGAFGERDGVVVEHSARAVLVATGGFASDPDLVRRHAVAATDAARILLGGGPGATGAGHRMLAEVGAQLVHMEAVWMYPFATPDPRPGRTERGLVLRGLDGDVWVNQAGRRFHDETLRGGATGTPALLAQRPATCWSVIDARMAASVVVADPAYRRDGVPVRSAVQQLLDASPYVARADDLAGLAVAAGVDSDGLRETMALVNAARRAGPDAGTGPGRLPAGTGHDPIEASPLYAIQLFPLARKTLGGVRTDLDCRVLGTDGSPISGLFAAGEVAGMAGGHINGSAALEGTMLGPSIFSGRVAGRRMAS